MPLPSPCSANAASASWVHPTSGAKPWTTAAGESNAERVTTKPAAVTTLVRPSPPTTRMVAPAGTRLASSRTAACADVVTSPQAAVRLLASLVPAGATILVVGGDGLTSVVTAAGFVVTRSALDSPAAVVQGFAPEVGWTQLAEAAFALQGEGSGIPVSYTHLRAHET